MRVRWTPPAADDLEKIYLYLSQHLPAMAESTVQELYRTAKSLKHFPNRGRHGREEGTRELVHPQLPYLVVYRVRADAAEILHIHHAAQDRT